MRIDELIIEPETLEHIAKHHVDEEEVYDVAFGRHHPEGTKQGRTLITGQTQAGRYLSLVLAPRGRYIYALVTARDAEPSERRKFQRSRGR